MQYGVGLFYYKYTHAIEKKGGWLQYFQFLEPTKEFTHKKKER